jgi:predicted phage tail protein
MSQLRTLHLHGELARVYGPRHKVVAKGSLFDALRIIDCNHPGFLRHVGRRNWHCLRGDKTLKHSIEMYPHHVTLPISGDFHLVPAIEGGKSRGTKIIFTIIVGGALLATGIGGALGAFGGVAGGLGAGLGTGIGFAGITYGTVALMGAGLLLGGLSMLLTPVPKDTNTADRKQDSFTFSGPVNTSDEGSVIPLAYGELIIGGITIASDINNGSGNVASTGGGVGGGGGTYSGLDGAGYLTGISGGGREGFGFTNYV